MQQVQVKVKHYHILQQKSVAGAVMMIQTLMLIVIIITIIIKQTKHKIKHKKFRQQIDRIIKLKGAQAIT